MPHGSGKNSLVGNIHRRKVKQVNLGLRKNQLYLKKHTHK